MRPSCGDIHIFLVAARAAARLILLPGILYLVVRAPNREKALVGMFCLLIFLGPTQERYYLPIYAILFLHVCWQTKRHGTDSSAERRKPR